MLYGCGYFNKSKYSVKIDDINFCGIIEAFKVMSINKGFEFRRKDGIVQ